MSLKSKQIKYTKDLIDRHIDNSIKSKSKMERDAERKSKRDTAAKLLRIRKRMHSESEHKMMKKHGRKYYRNHPKMLNELYETYIKGMR